VSIGSLPDDVLLEIFYQVSNHDEWYSIWPNLVHVCRRWRFTIFGSPLRLKLRLVCKSKTPVRKLLDIWPKFPLEVVNCSEWSSASEDGFGNLIDALEHHDRVQTILIDNPQIRGDLWERVVTVMREPFPELTLLYLRSFPDMLALPNTFLNGSASRLQHLTLLRNISFPSLPQFLLTTRDLTSLRLDNIPNSGYIPPERMATCLSVLLKLESLIIRFQSPTPDPKRRNRPVPPQTRSVLPALILLDFQGISEYLEVLAGRIDAPLLRFEYFKIVFFNQLVFDIPQTIRFFGHLDPFRTSSLSLTFNTSHPYSLFDSDSDSEAIFSPSDIPHLSSESSGSWHIKCNTLDWQVFSMAQICSQILSFCSSVESLVIDRDFAIDQPETEIDPTVWLQLFHSFPSVQRLRINSYFERSIAAALGGLTGESAADVFPSLHSLVIEAHGFQWLSPIDTAAPALEGIQSFVAARQHSGHPVAVSRT
jgi:F-box-like